MEFEKLYGDEFFIIDSNNLESVKQKLYGYGFKESELILDENLKNISDLNGIGAYLYVETDKNNIKIYQDYNGNYGLYVYKNRDYFAISNSFLKLAEYLKDKQKITFNEDYSNAYLFSGLCSFAYGETLINEINVLPRNYKVIIDKKKLSLNYEIIDNEEHIIPIDSKEGMKILDDWYFRWVNIIRALKQKTNNIEINLSGGFDTRIIAALWLTANIDTSQIKILSHKGNKHCLAEDYRIASMIAEEFDFKLNDNSYLLLDEYAFKDVKTIMDISFYTKLGFHNEMYWRFSRYSSPLFSITGNGGELIRSVYDTTTEKYVNNLIDRAEHFDNSLVSSTESVIKSGVKKVSEIQNVKYNSKELPERYYKEVRCRNHYGKSAVEKYFSNAFTLTPLTDPNLQKLKFVFDESEDRSLLITLILLRYCPKLLEFEVEGGREFKKEIIEKAKEINKKYKFKPVKNEFITLKNSEKKKYPRKHIKSPDRLLKKIAFSNSFETEFKKHFSSNLYRKLNTQIKTKKTLPIIRYICCIGYFINKRLC